MPQPLASKERTLFQQVVKSYENKQYKKGLKAVEQILKKNPNHGDTQAMKALILNSQGHTEDAFALAKLALRSDMKSHVCWHVYGLLYRSVKNFEESIKAYKFALKLEPESQQIQRDLALLQMQMRDYAGYVQSRRAMLQARPALRQNWTALAVAQHLDGDLEGAERTLTMYEESLRTQPPKTDLEHQECQLYKNNIIGEIGETQRALEHLDAITKNHYDRQTIMEDRAQYLMKLERHSEAAEIYRKLIDRNPDNRAYYKGLQQALSISDEDTTRRKQLYHSRIEKNPRADAPRRVPLDFLQGDEFREATEAYLQRMLTKGVPSTFANLKTLYTNPSKQQTIQDIVEDFASGKKAAVNGDADAGKQEAKQTQFELFTLYFLAQHYDYYKSRDLTKALELIDKAIGMKADSVDFHMTRARIFKHKGDIEEAAKIMEHARTLDERDRYINTKAAKYQLRNDMNKAAIDNMGKFTRQDAVGGPLGDLIDMQCMWFLWEEGESYLRQNKLGYALKRFTSIYTIFDVWQEDQFDFHSYSMRRGQIRAYVNLIRFEDRLREHPFWTRAAISAIRTYILLHEYPQLATAGNAGVSTYGLTANGAGEEVAAAAKKAAKKAAKEKAKQDQVAAEKRDAKKTAGGKSAEEDKKKEDKDPEGTELLATKTPLDEAMKFLTPMLELSPQSLEGQCAGFELYLLRQKYTPALRCLVTARSLGLDASKQHSMGTRLALRTLVRDAEPAPSTLPPAIQKLFEAHLIPLLPESLSGKKAGDMTRKQFAEAIETAVKQADSSIATMAAYECVAALDGAAWREQDKRKADAAHALATSLGAKEATMADATRTVGWCRDFGVDPAPVLEAAKKRWEGANVVRAGRA